MITIASLPSIPYHTGSIQPKKKIYEAEVRNGDDRQVVQFLKAEAPLSTITTQELVLASGVKSKLVSYTALMGTSPTVTYTLDGANTELFYSCTLLDFSYTTKKVVGVLGSTSGDTYVLLTCVWTFKHDGTDVLASM